MLPKLMQQFEEFARSKPADEKYEYQNPKECAVAQFAKSLGMDDQYYGLFDEKKIINPEPDYIFVEAEIYSATQPHTFGALAVRIKNEVHADKVEDVPETVGA